MQQNNLEEFITSGDENQIKDFLEKHPEAINEKTSFGVSPIMLSCYYQKKAITRILLTYQKDIDFFEACAADKFDVVAHKIFLQPDVINQFYDDGNSALGLACYFGNEEIARYLVLKGADVNIPSQNNFRVFPLHSAVAGNFIGIAKMLLDHQANPNISQLSGITPLHSAAQNGNVELIILLLEKGAQVEVRMEGGKLPADLARENGHLEIAEILA